MRPCILRTHVLESEDQERDLWILTSKERVRTQSGDPAAYLLKNMREVPQFHSPSSDKH